MYFKNPLAELIVDNKWSYNVSNIRVTIFHSIQKSSSIFLDKSLYIMKLIMEELFKMLFIVSSVIIKS